EGYLQAKPGKAALLGAFANQGTLGLGPTDEMPVESCGVSPMARLYTQDEVQQQQQQQQQGAPGLGSVQQLQQDYEVHVHNFREDMNTIRSEIIRRPHRAFRLAVVQWNSLLVQPNTFQLLAGFLSQTSGLSVDQVDGVAIMLQENLKLEQQREQQLLQNVRYVLNLLSSNPNWDFPSLHYLRNLVGTQLKALLLSPNTQALLLVLRGPFRGPFCRAEKTLFKREKGFIGGALSLPHFGTLGLMGAHLKGWEEAHFNGLFPELSKACGDPKKGLDSFDLGVVMAADWNEHLNAASLSHFYKLTRGLGSTYPAFAAPINLPEDTPDNLKMTAHLVEALGGPAAELERKYLPFLWGCDRLGRPLGPPEGAPGGAPTLHGALRQQGFSLISTCYRAGFSYKWQRGCSYPSFKAPKGHTAFNALKGCLAKKTLSSPRGAGFLDRVAVRLPGESSRKLQQLLAARAAAAAAAAAAGEREKKRLKTETETKDLPDVFASVTAGAQVFDLRSDHMQIVTVVEFLKLKSTNEQ
ncbi:hypothetical protein ETH_00007550, partial [Eimeria tenella]